MENEVVKNLSSEFKKTLKSCIETEAVRHRTHINLNRDFKSPEYVSKKNYLNICGLHYLLISLQQENSCLQNKNIEELLRLNKSTFKFLNDVLDCVPDAIAELKEHGVMYIVSAYNNHKVIDEQIKESIKLAEKVGR